VISLGAFLAQIFLANAIASESVMGAAAAKLTRLDKAKMQTLSPRRILTVPFLRFTISPRAIGVNVRFGSKADFPPKIRLGIPSPDFHPLIWFQVCLLARLDGKGRIPRIDIADLRTSPFAWRVWIGG